jgi:hypothetical protein
MLSRSQVRSVSSFVTRPATLLFLEPNLESQAEYGVCANTLFASDEGHTEGTGPLADRVLVFLRPFDNLNVGRQQRPRRDRYYWLSPTEYVKRNFVMPAWIAGIQFRMDASGNIHVNLDSSSPCWNDANDVFYLNPQECLLSVFSKKFMSMKPFYYKIPPNTFCQKRGDTPSLVKRGQGRFLNL